MKIIHIFIDKIGIIFYFIFLNQLWHLFQYGENRKRLFILIISITGCLVCIVLWIWLRKKVKHEDKMKSMNNDSIDNHFKEKDRNNCYGNKRFYITELIICLFITLYFGCPIVYSLLKNNDKASSNSDNNMHLTSVENEENNDIKVNKETINNEMDKKQNQTNDNFNTTDGSALNEESNSNGQEQFTINQNDGSVSFCMNDKICWRLIVTDSSAGSRYYELERSQDSGNTWQNINQDPFNNNTGVAEGLIFYDENFGIAGLSGASQSHSTLYITRDGGITFTELILPVDTVTRLPSLAKDLNFSIDDYSYYEMPQKNGDKLTIKALTQAGENEGILFKSDDSGVTWVYDGIVSQ